MRVLRQFLCDEAGATGIEYGLIIALLTLVIVTGIGRVGDVVETMFANQDDALRQAFDR